MSRDRILEKMIGTLENTADGEQFAICQLMHFGPVITPLGRPPVLLKGEPKVHYIMVPLEFRKRGDKLFMQGNLAEAILCYQEALKLKPDYAEVYNNMGMAFKRQNQLEAAVKCYRDALKINPEYDVACNNLANAFNEMGQRVEVFKSRSDDES